MIYRQTNNENGYQLRNLNESGYLGYSRYPIQKEEYLNKCICIRYKSEYYEEVNQRFHIPEGYYDDYIYPENSGLRNLLFRIIRWDDQPPYTAILINKLGHVIVTKTKELEGSLFDLTDSRILKAVQSCSLRNRMTYLILNETDDPNLFFDKLFYEKVKVYPVQNEPMIGLTVYSEFDKDLIYTDRNQDVLQYKNHNKYKITEDMIWEMIKRDPILYSYHQRPEAIEAFPYYYNPHRNVKVDDSRRAINMGYIIRADIHDYIEPEYVVMEILEETVRFVTQHDANFFYSIDNMYNNKTIKDPGNMTPVFDIISPYLNNIDTGNGTY